jgi:hypothetical protein
VYTEPADLVELDHRVVAGFASARVLWHADPRTTPASGLASVTTHAGGGWLFCTKPLEDPSEADIAPRQVRLLGEDEYVPVPPSRLPGRRTFWLRAQRFPDTALPPARPVLVALATAAVARLAVLGSTDDPARTAGRVAG